VCAGIAGAVRKTPVAAAGTPTPSTSWPAAGGLGRAVGNSNQCRGGARTTREEDRKGVVLDRIRTFLQKGVIPAETRFNAFNARIVCFDLPPADLTPDDRVFYRRYDKSNRQMIALMNELTDGGFRDGAIARILAREFWTRGKAPTFKEFAAARLQAVQEHTAPNPEWAFLSDRTRGTAAKDWKRLRVKNRLVRFNSTRRRPPGWLLCP
jgi:hypothetical protein